MLKIDRHSIRSSAEYKTKHHFELILGFQLTKQSYKSAE